MKHTLLRSGALAGALFFSSIYVLGTALPEYSHVSRTVSEIGRIGSTVALPFQIAMLAVNLFVILFAVGLFRFARSEQLPVLPAFFILWFGLIDVGTNVFPSPHELHNVFGLALTLGYMAPLATAIAWRRHDKVRAVVVMSWLTAALLFISIFLNISPAFNRGLYPLEYYGLVQRSAFLLIYGWFAWTALWACSVSNRDSAKRNPSAEAPATHKASP